MYASHESKFSDGEVDCPTLPLHRINLNPLIFIKGHITPSYQEYMYTSRMHALSQVTLLLW